MIAVGGTEKMHRTVRSAVLRGLGPGDAEAEVSMKKMLRYMPTRSGGLHGGRILSP